MIDDTERRLRGEALRGLAESLEGRPVIWGPDGDDCSQLPLQWVVGWRQRMTGVCPDVDAPAYASREEAQAVIAAAGGLVAVWMPICRALGLAPLGPADLPEIGDVGIMETSRGQSGGIFIGGGMLLIRAETDDGRSGGWRSIDVVGRSFPRRTAEGWRPVPALAAAWRL